MKKTALFVVSLVVLLVGPAVFAQNNKPAEPPKEQTDQSQTAERRRFEDLTPEERAKLRDQWQNMSEEDKAKLKEKIREKAAAAKQNPQAQGRGGAVSIEITRLKEEHKVNIAELQAIKQLAVKENAKETTEALTKLIAKREKQYEQQMQVLERRLKAVQGDSGTKTGTAGQAQGNKSQSDQGAPPTSTTNAGKSNPNPEKKPQ
jgi:hypothetical protein